MATYTFYVSDGSGIDNIFDPQCGIYGVYEAEGTTLVSAADKSGALWDIFSTPRFAEIDKEFDDDWDDMYWGDEDGNELSAKEEAEDEVYEVYKKLFEKYKNNSSDDISILANFDCVENGPDSPFIAIVLKDGKLLGDIGDMDGPGDPSYEFTMIEIKELYPAKKMIGDKTKAKELITCWLNYGDEYKEYIEWILDSYPELG